MVSIVSDSLLCKQPFVVSMRHLKCFHLTIEKRYNLLRQGASWGMKILRLCNVYSIFGLIDSGCASRLKLWVTQIRFFLFLWKVCNFLIQLLLSLLTGKTKSWSTSFWTVINCYFHMNSCSWLRICTCSWK